MNARHIPSLFADHFRDMDKMFVGFEDQFDRLARLHHEATAVKAPNYPPYNIRKVEELKYVIEIAVAGFRRDEIDIEYAENKLIVKGEINRDDKESADFLFKGIADRSFTRTFVLDDQVEIRGAALENGMLMIALERVIPEEKKPKKIDLMDRIPNTYTLESNNGNSKITSEKEAE